MLTLSDAALNERANALRNHGASVPEEVRHRGPKPYLLPAFDMLGYNYRMTDLQAAIGLVQLGKLDRFIHERQQGADFYSESLSELQWLRLPSSPTDGQHAWQAYVTYVDPERAPMPRDDIMERLQHAGIATRPGTHAVHGLGYYQESFGFSMDDFPASRDCAAYTMALPLHNKMSSADYERVVDALHHL